MRGPQGRTAPDAKVPFNVAQRRQDLQGKPAAEIVAEALRFVLAAIADELEVFFRFRRCGQRCVRPEFINEPHPLWVVGEPVVCEHRQHVEVILEICDLDGDPDLVVRGRNAKAIPEVRESELARAVGERRVQQQPQCMEQVALADAVFANNDDVAR